MVNDKDNADTRQALRDPHEFIHIRVSPIEPLSPWRPMY